MPKTNISPKWTKLSVSVLGNKNGIHCHWCKYKKSKDGEVHCTNKKSMFSDKDRIRTWDGDYCAKKCGLFELDKWYSDDKNYDEYFKEEGA
jgi:hypothetical protein